MPSLKVTLTEGIDVVVGEQVLDVVHVVQDHAGPACVGHGRALLDPGRPATETEHDRACDVPGEGDRRVAKLVAVIGGIDEGELIVGSRCDRGAFVDARSRLNQRVQRLCEAHR